MMSSVQVTTMSSTRIRNRIGRILVIVALFGSIACIRPGKPTGAGIVSDRLLTLLLTQSLPLGEPGSAVHGEVQRCGLWIREQLEAESAQGFKLDTGTSSLVAEGTGVVRVMTPELAKRLVSLNRFFQTNAAVDRSVFSSEHVRQLILAPDAVTRIQELIGMDREETMSETGGMVVLDPTSGRILFHVIRPDNARWLDRLNRADSDQAFSAELTRILPSLPFIRVRAQRTLDILGDPGASLDERSSARSGFLDLLTGFSRYSYILDQGTQYAAVAEYGIVGTYMGVFHLHPPDNPPSIEDKIGSILRKNFVVIPHETGFEVHYLDFSGDLNADPTIIRWP
ncbi:hypothetical protein JXA80_06165 [bacterium]|nr:hypothetical protein [candidate division CSSED10-310 bacterium]